ncbi:DUF6053 domain-containing protein [Lysobacter enzymogenes]|uniref:DUF6053 domain-containing protein n=1 Tax=Lysobacter enzymogenes TaxID=69 RepID=UPI003D189207
MIAAIRTKSIGPEGPPTSFRRAAHAPILPRRRRRRHPIDILPPRLRRLGGAVEQQFGRLAPIQRRTEGEILFGVERQFQRSGIAIALPVALRDEQAERFVAVHALRAGEHDRAAVAEPGGVEFVGGGVYARHRARVDEGLAVPARDP